jgi:2-polyprenyl-3-methyl-5-hydroxy-6-metoxy-1,4-benzoquinol methylase
MFSAARWWVKQLARLRPPEWDGGHIQDAWFDAHFNYAADVVAEWIGAERLARAQLLDFGSGDGITMLGLMLRHGLPDATGADISATHLGLQDLALRQIGMRRLPRKLRFHRIVPGQAVDGSGRFDVIMTWSTFEHIERRYLPGVLRNLRELLTPDGVMFLQINPLFYSPQGSHLGRFQLPPWAHLAWDDQRLRQAVMAFQGEIPSDEMEENFHVREFDAYKQFVLNEYDQLNRLTAAELVTLLNDSGFKVVREQYSEVDLQPPPELVERFGQRDLMIEEIRLLLAPR